MPPFGVTKIVIPNKNNRKLYSRKCSGFIFYTEDKISFVHHYLERVQDTCLSVPIALTGYSISLSL
jgi:hypothetical protein